MLRPIVFILLIHNYSNIYPLKIILKRYNLIQPHQGANVIKGQVKFSFSFKVFFFFFFFPVSYALLTTPTYSTSVGI